MDKRSSGFAGQGNDKCPNFRHANGARPTTDCCTTKPGSPKPRLMATSMSTTCRPTAARKCALLNWLEQPLVAREIARRRAALLSPFPAARCFSAKRSLTSLKKTMCLGRGHFHPAQLAGAGVHWDKAMAAMSHPLLQPGVDCSEISQVTEHYHHVDVGIIRNDATILTHHGQQSAPSREPYFAWQHNLHEVLDVSNCGIQEVRRTLLQHRYAVHNLRRR